MPTVPTHEPPPSTTLCSAIDLGRPAPRDVATPPPGLAARAWIYLAPADAEDAGPPTLRSTPSDTGPTPRPPQGPSQGSTPDPSSADVVPLRTTDTVVLTPGRAAVVAGGTLPISASAPALDALTWSIFPRGTGTIAPSEPGSARATYTAPTAVTAPMVVMVMAYGMDGAVGIGVARVTVTPAAS